MKNTLRDSLIFTWHNVKRETTEKCSNCRGLEFQLEVVDLSGCSLYKRAAARHITLGLHVSTVLSENSLTLGHKSGRAWPRGESSEEK